LLHGKLGNGHHDELLPSEGEEGQFGFKGQLCQKHFLQLPAPLTAYSYSKKFNIISVSLSFPDFSSYGHKVSGQRLLLTIFILNVNRFYGSYTI
jgi:hypothetical protein